MTKNIVDLNSNKNIIPVLNRKFTVFHKLAYFSLKLDRIMDTDEKTSFHVFGLFMIPHINSVKI